MYAESWVLSSPEITLTNAPTNWYPIKRNYTRLLIIFMAKIHELNFIAHEKVAILLYN